MTVIGIRTDPLHMMVVADLSCALILLIADNLLAIFA
jgi:hypothetical protein